MKKVVVRSGAAETASVLGDEIMSTESDADEWFIGSEDDVMRALGVSRPTLRQAVRILEHQQLLTVRRGIGGGLFGRRPSGDAVTHMASLFLRSQGATFEALIQTQILLGDACADLAARNPDDAQRARVANYYAEALPDGPNSGSASQFRELAGGFQTLVAEVAGNPCLTLFVNVLMDLARPVGVQIFADRTHIEQTVRNHQKVGNAVLRGKAPEAARLMRKHLETLLSWTDTQLRVRTVGHPSLALYATD
jgi:GntR family transcriptional regulator, transcriptional repressor for pyruvate dehydrogenase complex